MPLESTVSDATIWSVALEPLVTILEASYTVIYDVYSTDINYEDCKLITGNMFNVNGTVVEQNKC
jgi:hypothetical protein